MQSTTLKTLYVSDLDETLLGSDERLSEFTKRTVNELIARGMLFSFATARSYTTASEVTHGLTAQLPVITYNGTFIWESGTQRLLYSLEFSQQEVAEILAVLRAHHLSPMIRTRSDTDERITYRANHITRGMQKYLNRRTGDRRLHPTEDDRELSLPHAFCVTCMDEQAPLLAAKQALDEKFRCLCFVDIYTGEHWLEIQPRKATKSNAILTLKRLLGCERVVCFGNGINDICMFEVADACYAVANAEPELKAIATAVIPSNDEDGVAHSLLALFENKPIGPRK